jgi:hypothetical protein
MATIYVRQVQDLVAQYKQSQHVFVVGLVFLVSVLMSAPTALVLNEELTVLQVPQAEPFSLPLNWKGLVPLHSNRLDVERVLGSARRSYGQFYVYENEAERVTVWYSSGKCGRGPDSWRVPADIMTRLEVFPAKSAIFRDFLFDRSKFERRKWARPGDWVTYSNDADGISIEVTDYGGDTEELRSIVYKPKSKDKQLKCEGL